MKNRHSAYLREREFLYDSQLSEFRPMNLTPVSHQISPSWHSAAGGLRLPPDEVHIWRVALQMESSALWACWDLLSPEETRLASSYRFVKDLREFVITRAVLRQVLTRYTGQSPADLRFESNPGGKPVLQGAQTLHFSVSHCSAAISPHRSRYASDRNRRRTCATWKFLAKSDRAVSSSA